MKLSTFIYIASFLDGLDDVAKLLAFFAALGSIVAFIMFIVVRAAKTSGEKVDEIEPFTKFLRVRYWLPAFFVFSSSRSQFLPRRRCTRCTVPNS